VSTAAASGIINNALRHDRETYVKFAVVQHASRPAPAQDLEALVLAVSRAAALGAETVFLPYLPALYEGPLADELLRRIAAEAPSVEVVTAQRAQDAPAHLPTAVMALFGPGVVLVGDDAIDLEVLHRCIAEKPGVLLLSPGAESDLQSQAVIELALALSTSLASLVLVAETDGAELGEPGHGGSAVLHLGQVLAEAASGDDLLLADVVTPLGPPEAPEAMPEIPPVLLQRLAAHRGRKLDVAYPADLD